MRNPLEFVDQWLLDRVYEPLSWRCEIRWRKDNFVLARIAVSVAMFIFAAESFLFALLFFMQWLQFIFLIGLCEKRVKSRPFFQNYWRPKCLVRCLVILVSTLQMSAMSHRGGWFLISAEAVAQAAMVSFFYFMSCNPKPPKWKPKPRERAGSLKLARLPIR